MPQPPSTEELEYCASVVEALLETLQQQRNDLVDLGCSGRHFLVREIEHTITRFMLLQVSIGFAREGGEPNER